jgi:hypothetical protein
MALCSLLRDSLRRLLCAAALASLGGVAVAADEPPHVVLDPHYGDSLFHFYQEHYFTAITGLMVSQHFNRVAQHADEAEVLRGGMLLSYGLHREAGDIFARLIDKGTRPSVRDRAWFYLAKIRYQRGLVAEAGDAIGHIGNKLPADLEEERVLLQANILLAQADYAGASKVLAGMTTSTGAGQYARYNLGVALIKSGDPVQGSALLDELGRATAPDEELRSLRDQANVALGFSALQNRQPEDARKYLERVRLNGMHSNKALLGFGWASAELKNDRQALVPWTELARRDASDAAVLEARIAVPYAYAELGAIGQALDRYNDAIVAFEVENKHLDESIVAIRSGKLLAGLIERNPGTEMGWFWSMRGLPEMPHAGHLVPVLAQHEFQEAFKNYRDLQFLSRNLQQWEDSLAVLGDMLANRRMAYAERLPQVRAKAQETDLAGLQQRRDVLAGELTQVEEARDGAAFADARQRALLARLDNVRATLNALGADPEFASARERLRLAAGAMTWNLAQQYPLRLWEAKKTLAVTDSQLGEARRRDVALAQAQRDEPARFAAFAARTAELDKRIRALQPQVAALAREQQADLQELAVAELVRQKERLAAYATQARFAVAQLYDRANSTAEAGHAARQ